MKPISKGIIGGKIADQTLKSVCVRCIFQFHLAFDLPDLCVFFAFQSILLAQQLVCRSFRFQSQLIFPQRQQFRVRASCQPSCS